MAGTASADYFQGFETNTDGWIEWGGTVTQVASGTNGVPSASGGYHAEVAVGPGTGDGAFTRFGGYSSVWPGMIIQSLDIYIDPAAGAVGDGWFLDNAVNDNTGTWTEAGGVGALKATDGFWWVAADADGGGYPGPASGGVGLQITAAGWYTIVSEWVENGDGLTVDRDTYIYDSGGLLLYSNLNPQNENLATIGGHRYGWLAGNAPTSMVLAIDNSRLFIPEIENLDTGETFLTIQDAIDDANTLDGHTLEVQAATHFEGPQVHVTKDLTIKGGSPDVIKATGDTGSGGDARGWFLVDAGVVLHVQDLILDGNGYLIFQAFRHKGSGSFSNCGFTGIKYNESGPDYSGLAIAAFGDGSVDVSGCTFDQIGRIGVLYFGSGINGSVYSGNVYTGKGDGDWLDYGVELGGGAVATIANSTITDCRGVASSDGSTSAGILATDYYDPDTAGTVTSTTVTANTVGIHVGYGGTDATVMVANYNSITGNTSDGLYSVSSVVVDALYNWWGDASGPEDLLGSQEADNPPCYPPDPTLVADVSNTNGAGDAVSDGNVAYCPWLLSPATLSLNPDATGWGPWSPSPFACRR
jgi:hypothetical protein